MLLCYVAYTFRGSQMAKTTKTTGSARVGTKKAGPRAFRLDPERLAAARRVLGTPNDTATIDAALDYVVFGRELRVGAESLGALTFDAFERTAEA